jgi:hypothetical protein
VIHSVLNQWLLEDKKFKEISASRSTNSKMLWGSGRAVSVFDE